ncbi:MAG: hypothetical protein AAFO75_06290 [Pseudomonadota bacterium]
MDASHSGLPSVNVDTLEEKLRSRLVRVRKLLDEQSEPGAVAHHIHEADLLEAELLRYPEHREHCRAAAESGSNSRSCDPWIAVSF